jgi:hypothetical protein
MEILSDCIKGINLIIERLIMSDHTYKIMDLVGTSPNSIEEAVKNAIEKAARSVRNMRWLQIMETRGHIDNQKVSHWQVVIKISFTLED